MTLLVARRAALLGALALLSACGDEEAAQRKAFIAFLQTRILDKPGLRVPTPTAEEAKSWGGYAKHYDIITAFNAELSRFMAGPIKNAMERSAVRSLDDLVAKRGDIAEVKSGMTAFGADLDKQLATAQSARAALSQPADLKTAYDAAFERTVTAPAQAFKEALPAMDAAFAAALDVSGFMARNRNRITVQGASVQVADPALLREFNAKLAAMQAEQPKVLAAQRRIAALISGN